jgi:hypothetical protein
MTPGFSGPFKGDPQPGTLFDKRALDQLPGNINLTRQRPGPRGYSPARLAEIRANFHAKVEVGTDMNETAHYFGPSHYDPHADPGGPIANRARSRMLDTLARSTIPTNEYEDVPAKPRPAGRRGSSVEKPTSDPLVGLKSIRTYSRPPHNAPAAAAEYMSHGTQMRPGQPHLRPSHLPDVEPTKGPTIGIYPNNYDDYGRPVGSNAALKGRDPQAEQTFLHEVGHHDSYVDASESSLYETPAQQAAEEGRADRFAVQHFRPDPRNKEPYDPRQHTYLGRGMAGFGGHYAWYEQALPKDMRPAPPKQRNLGVQFEQPELEPAKGRHVVGDIFTEPGVWKKGAVR